MKKFIILFLSITLFPSYGAVIAELDIIADVGDLVIVEIPINGHKGKFLVDSGSNACFVDPSFAKKISNNSLKRTHEKDRKILTFGKKIKGRAYKLNFKLGKKHFDDLLTYENPLKKFDKKRDGVDCCDGILGANFLKLHPIMFEKEKKKITIMDSFSPKGHFKTLKMNLIGRDIPVVECKSTVTGKLKLRLDSGAEAPLILQPGFIKKNHLMAGIYEQDPKHPTMPLLDIGKLECHGINHVKANALLYSGHTGALAHEFVDGNLGAQFLGKRYVFDFKKNAIHIDDTRREKSIELSFGKNYKLDPSRKKRFPGYPGGILMQADALMIKSCTESSPTSSCLIKKCLLHGITNCDLPGKGDKLNKAIQFLTKAPSTKRPCGPSRLRRDLVNHPLKYSYCWWRSFKEHNPWKGSKSIRKEFWDSRKKAVHIPMNIDRKITMAYTYDPVIFTKNFYCYYIYKGITTYAKLPPEMFAFSLKGVSLSNKDLDNYKKWINSNAGLVCRKKLNNKLGIIPNLSLEKLFLKKTEYYVEVNPLTI
ncbi:MAG: retropepsin-like domain-containing protein, partial [Bacteriovoracaceae bacterium]|nr:retropepsin-like domain-containing protein [Bacteriovoracaceae bacterium]